MSDALEDFMSTAENCIEGVETVLDGKNKKEVSPEFCYEMLEDLVTMYETLDKADRTDKACDVIGNLAALVVQDLDNQMKHNPSHDTRVPSIYGEVAKLAYKCKDKKVAGLIDAELKNSNAMDSFTHSDKAKENENSQAKGTHR